MPGQGFDLTEGPALSLTGEGCCHTHAPESPLHLLAFVLYPGPSLFPASSALLNGNWEDSTAFQSTGLERLCEAAVRSHVPLSRSAASEGSPWKGSVLQGTVLENLFQTPLGSGRSAHSWPHPRLTRTRRVMGASLLPPALPEADCLSSPAPDTDSPGCAF